MFSTGAKIDDMSMLKELLVQVKRVYITYAFPQRWCEPAPLMKALHDPWCLLFFVSTGKSSWVHSRTQGLFSLLLQMTCFIRASARPASTLRVMRTRSLGHDRLLVPFLNAFVGWWSVRLAVVFELMHVLCFRYFMNSVCNNLWLYVLKANFRTTCEM
jgi:hypothetical protein